MRRKARAKSILQNRERGAYNDIYASMVLLMLAAILVAFIFGYDVDCLETPDEQVRKI